MTATGASRETIEFLRRLRSVRDYRPDPVPQEALDDILEVARWTGSAKNNQAWEFVVVTDRDVLRSLGAIEEQGNVRFLADAPLAIALVFEGENFNQESYDEGRLTERIMLAAKVHGLGSNMAWYNETGAPQVRQILGIPEDRFFRSIIAIGYPNEEVIQSRPRRPQARKPLSTLVHEGRYRGSD